MQIYLYANLRRVHLLCPVEALSKEDVQDLPSPDLANAAFLASAVLALSNKIAVYFVINIVDLFPNHNIHYTDAGWFLQWVTRETV